MKPSALAVIGAGTMGRGIAHVALFHGWSVRLYDASAEALGRARQWIDKRLQRDVEKGRLDAPTAEAARKRLVLAGSLEEAARGVEVAIESVPEDLALKQRVFETLEEAVPEGALLGSNTSSLSLTALASVLRDPSRAVGLHFFNPPHVVVLLEIVRAEQTAPATVERARALGASLRRECIVVRDTPGFATSRLGLAIGLEAMRMVEEGVATAEDIDRAMVYGYRFPMGPLRLSDLVGLDVRLAIAEHLTRELGDRFRPPPLLRRMVRAGYLGRKTGRGFYEWPDAP